MTDEQMDIVTSEQFLYAFTMKMKDNRYFLSSCGGRDGHSGGPLQSTGLLGPGVGDGESPLLCWAPGVRATGHT